VAAAGAVTFALGGRRLRHSPVALEAGALLVVIGLGVAARRVAARA
jgi:hypothetical protein